MPETPTLIVKTPRTTKPRITHPPPRRPRLVLHVLFDADSYGLWEFFYRRRHELGRATAHHARIRGTGDRRQSDQVYRSSRAGKQKLLDDQNARKYAQHLVALGNDEMLHRIEQTDALASSLAVPREEFPCIVFRASGSNEVLAKLPVPRHWYATTEARLVLSRTLQQFLAGQGFRRVCDPAVPLEDVRTSLGGLLRGLSDGLEREIAAHSSPARNEAPPSPVLVLRPIADRKRHSSIVAELAGQGKFGGVAKRIGRRELFCLHLLSQSETTRSVNGELYTVFVETDAVEELKQWSKAGHLALGGADRRKPSDRVKKNWHEFVRQMEKDRRLRALFLRFPGERGRSDTAYGVRLRPGELQNLIPNLASLLSPD